MAVLSEDLEAVSEVETFVESTTSMAGCSSIIGSSRSDLLECSDLVELMTLRSPSLKPEPLRLMPLAIAAFSDSIETSL